MFRGKISIHPPVEKNAKPLGRGRTGSKGRQNRNVARVRKN